MEIDYKSNVLKRICEDASFAQKKHGEKMAEAIQRCIDIIHSVDSVETLVQYRLGKCHALTGDRKSQYAMTLVQPYRLVFEKHAERIMVRIIEIVDYH